MVLGAMLPGRYGPAGVYPEGSCRKDQRARNHDPLGRMTASGLLCLKERRLRRGGGREDDNIPQICKRLLLREQEKNVLPGGKQEK